MTAAEYLIKKGRREGRHTTQLEIANKMRRTGIDKVLIKTITGIDLVDTHKKSA